MSLSVRDFVAGWGAGVCGLIVGHPADTVKVRQQVSKKSSILNILVITIKRESVYGLYRGMFFPLLLAGVQNSIFFGIYGNVLRTFQKLQGENVNRRTCGEGLQPNKYWHLNVYFAGFLAAFIHSFVGCPVDLIKIKLQAQSGSEELNKHRLTQCFRKIHQHSGLLGFYQGFLATLIRDVPICGMYVLLYEHLLSLGRSESDRSIEYSIGNQLLAGGLAGTITWVAVTPLDVVKSRIQADDIGNPKYNGIVDCIVKSYKEGGVVIFGRGFWIHVIRGFPVNAATFVGYEWCFKACTFLD